MADILEIIIKVVDQASANIKKIKRQVSSISAAVDDAQRRFKGFGKEFEKSLGIKNMPKYKKNIDDIFAGATKQSNMLNQNNRKVAQSFMGLGFSLLFTGMALNKFFDGAIKSAINAYKIVGTENSIFTQKTNELSAAWEFFKFSLIDALSNSELFIYLIDNVIQLINYLGQLNPNTLAFIAGGLGFGYVATKISEILGTLVLLGIGIATLPTPIAIGLGVAFAIASVAAFMLLAALDKITDTKGGLEKIGDWFDGPLKTFLDFSIKQFEELLALFGINGIEGAWSAIGDISLWVMEFMVGGIIQVIKVFSQWAMWIEFIVDGMKAMAAFMLGDYLTAAEGTINSVSNLFGDLAESEKLATQAALEFGDLMRGFRAGPIAPTPGGVQDPLFMGDVFGRSQADIDESAPSQDLDVASLLQQINDSNREAFSNMNMTVTLIDSETGNATIQ